MAPYSATSQPVAPADLLLLSTVPFESIPLATSLNTVYTKQSLLDQGKRWDNLAIAFKDHFNVPLQKISRAPGRVNVIGEHIDYCGFSVLPAAIERDVLVAFAVPEASDALPQTVPGSTTFHLANLDPAFTPTELQVDLLGDGTDLPMRQVHHWSNYFIAGTKGMLEYLHEHPASTPLPPPPPHVFVMITGSVPVGSGLSSSAAITTASVVTILELSGRRDGEEKIGRRAVTNVAIESERLVGVNSGGMDQSASVFSQPLNLLHIKFIPSLLAIPIPLPQTTPALSFVIANTLITSSKALTAKFHYNLRVVETLLGARLLAHHLNIPIPSSALGEKPLTYKVLIDTYFNSTPSAPGPQQISSDNVPEKRQGSVPTVPALPCSPLAPVDEKNMHEIKLMLGIAATALGGPGMEDGMTWEQVAKKLGVDRDELEKEVVGDQEVEPVGGKLKIWTRARHVLSEALRVFQFKDLIKGAPDGCTTLLPALGELMNESQASCRDDYECSCPEINEVVELALKNGALGSRVTGAGWGGATVSLVPEPEVPAFIKALKEGYYAKRFPNLTQNELDDACFATKPEAGACLFVQT
ncbi:hypothetical protein P7C70_g132, partial [Phenoliferia sp. Uapishka_3]